MTQTTEKPVLPLPERVLTWTTGGVNVTLSAETARSLARDAIRARAAKPDPVPPPKSGRLFQAAVVTMVLAATQLIDWVVVVFGWVF